MALLNRRHKVQVWLLAAATVLTGPGASQANDAQENSIPVGSVPREAGADRAEQIAIGDRLKMTLFQDLRPERNTQKGIVSGLVERTEMSGEYVVQQDGTVYLPLIDSVTVAGRGVGQIKHELETRFAVPFGSGVKMVIQLTDREPVYVTGQVANPGSFKYVPGMIALHALSLAGAFENVSSDLWHRVEFSRERERVEKSRRRLAQLIARRIVLNSERTGIASKPSSSLGALVGPSAADTAVLEEETLRELERNSEAEQKRAVDAQIQAVNKELGGLHERMSGSGASVKEKSDYVEMLRGMRARAATTDMNFHLAQGELNNARQIFDSIRTSILASERHLLELQERKVRIGIDARIAREREIRSINDAIAQERLTQSTFTSVLALGVDVSPRTADSATLDLHVVRRTPFGVTTFACDEFAPLRPGDVLEVSRRPASVPVGSPVDRRLDDETSRAASGTEAFLAALAARESSGDYAAVNTLGYLGRYQFGEPALSDLGYYVQDGTPENDWTGKWTGKNGVESKADFLASHAAQDKAIREWVALLWRYAVDPGSRLDKFVGSNVTGIPVTPAAIVAGAHLVGINAVKSFLESSGADDPVDPYGTPLSEYMRTFGGYDICDMIERCAAKLEMSLP